MKYKEIQEQKKIKLQLLNKKNLNKLKEKGITLIALVVTIIFSYDEKLKSSNNNGFLLQTI